MKESFLIKTAEYDYLIEPKRVLGRPDTYMCFDLTSGLKVLNYKTGKNIIIHLKATLPYINQLVKKNQLRRNYTTLYVSLALKQAQKLRNLARKQGKTESETLRDMLDTYFKEIETKGLPFEPYRKILPLGMKILPRRLIPR